MPRPDLLALTLEDLESFSNRGLVKRAVKEFESAESPPTISETDAGDVTVSWPDGIRCEIGAKATLAQARCTCDATSLCRHVLRSVLAYQRHIGSAPAHADTPPAESADAGVSPSSEPAAPPTETPQPSAPDAAPWDPGRFSDAQLEEFAAKLALTRARKLFNDGLVVELRRAAKPSAYIHDLAMLVRFLVPNDLRYARCDCGDAAPCVHALASVLAFRSLAPDRTEGLVETARRPAAGSTEILDQTEAALSELLELGFAAAPQSLIDRLRRLEEALQSNGYAWPSAIIHELLLEHSRYTQQDARFDSANAAALAGEFLARADALRSPSCPLPPLFVGGSKRDKASAIEAARLIGIGCEARPARGGIRLVAYLQDSDSGQVVAMEDFHADPKAEDAAAARSFADLGAISYVRGLGLAAVGQGQFLMKGGWRTPSGVLTPGRAKLTTYPQVYRWESLRAPLLCEGFAEVRSHLVTQPPSSLGPRKLGASLFVVPLGKVEKALFDAAEQSLLAVLTDPAGERAVLTFPYFSRGAKGFTALERALEGDVNLLFLSGHARLDGPDLIWQPVGIVLQEGGNRRLLQPWVEATSAPKSAGQDPSEREHGPGPGPDTHFARELIVAAGELLVLGMARADAAAARRWQSLVTQGESLGLRRFVEAPAALRDALQNKGGTVRWHAAPAIAALLTTLAQARLALDFPMPR